MNLESHLPLVLDLALKSSAILLAAFAVALNAFGALTFARAGGSGIYVIERTQRVIHQPD